MICGTEGIYGVEERKAQCHLNCVEGKVSFTVACCLHKCLTSQTKNHGKNLKTEGDAQRFLSSRIYLDGINTRNQKMEMIISSRLFYHILGLQVFFFLESSRIYTQVGFSDVGITEILSSLIWGSQLLQTKILWAHNYSCNFSLKVKSLWLLIALYIQSAFVSCSSWTT